MKRKTVCIVALFIMVSLFMNIFAASAPAAGPAAGRGLPVLSGARFDRLRDETVSEPVPVEETDNIFSAKFEGDNVAGTASGEDGKYTINATKTDGEAWHIKLECNYHTVPGRDYRVSYQFRSTVGGTVKFGDFQEFPISAGENTVTGVLSARADTSYLDLQLGALAPFTAEFTRVTVEELEDKAEYEDVTSPELRYDAQGFVRETHDDGYLQTLERAEDAATLHVTQAPMALEVWQSKLFVKTDTTLEPGSRYRVSAELTANRDMDFEICYNNGIQEKGYAARYGLHAKAGVPTTVQQTIAVPAEGFRPRELILQFMLGKADKDTDITVQGIRVEKIDDDYTSLLPEDFALTDVVFNGVTSEYYTASNPVEVPLPLFDYFSRDTVFEGHDDGYVVHLVESPHSATIILAQVPECDRDRGVWKARLYVSTGLFLQAGVPYRIRFDLGAAYDQSDYEICFDGDYENAYGALYGQSLKAGEFNHVEYLVTPDATHGPLTIRLQLGKTDTEIGNTISINNLHVEMLDPSYETVGTVTLSTGSRGNVREEHYDGVAQTLGVSDNAAVLNVSTGRSEGGVWSSKLFVDTGVVLEAGERYRVSATVDATNDTGDFEILYQNTTGETLYGGQWGLNGPGTYSSDFVAPEVDLGELELVFQLGNAAAENTITVSNIQVCKISGGTLTDVELPGFAYPEASDQTVEYNSFDLEANSGAAATLTGNGSSATATVTTPGEDWNVKLYAKPGVTLEAGKTYTISMDVSGADGCTACYKNTATGAEDGFGTETIGSGTVTHTVTPTEGGTLEILLKIGNLPANTEVTVSNVRVTQTGTGYIPQTLSGFAYPTSAVGSLEKNSFDLEANSGAAAELTGDGSSATATVTTPGDDWHVKLYAKPGIELEAGTTYTIEMDVSGADGCTACFKNTATGVEDGFGFETISSGSVRHTVTPSAAGTLEIVLKIGNVPANTKVTVKNVRVFRTESAFTPQTLSGFGYPTVTPGSEELGSFALETNGGAAAELTGDGSSATATVTTPGDDWHVKLYAKPGLALEVGKTYTIAMNVSGADGCTACFKNTATGAEDGFGTETISGGSVRHTITPTEAGTLEIVLKLGTVAAGTAVKVSGVQITETASDYKPQTLSGFGYPVVTPASNEYNSFDLEANNGAAAELTGDGSSATAKVTTPGDDWHVKLYAKPQVNLEAGKTYRIRLDVTGAEDCTVCYKNTATGNEEGFGTETIGTDTTITHTVTPSESGTLEILLKIGNVPAGTEVKVSNVQIEENKDAVVSALSSPIAYPGSFDLEANSGAAADLSGSGSSAAATVTTPGADWNVKFYVKPHVTLQAGKTYEVKLHVTNAAGCPVCFKDLATGNEEGFGVTWIGSADETVTQTIRPESEGELELMLKIGNLASGTEVNVSGVEVNERTTAFSPMELPDFKYPMTVEASETPNSFELEANSGAAAALGGDGSFASATITTPGDDWNVKLYAKTGFTLKAGTGYRVSMDVTGASGCTACYKNADTSAEDGFGTEAITDGTVTHTVTPDQDGTLEILLKLGNLSAGTTVTVKDIRIEADEPTESDVLPESFAYPLTVPETLNQNSFELEASNGTAATLSGDGSSATATVVRSGDDWHIKLYAKTGFALAAGQSYRISMNVTGADGCQICYKNTATGAEDGFGTETAASGTVTHTVTPDTGGTLEILLKLGDLPDGTVVTVKDIQIEQDAPTQVEAELPGFAYPVSTPGEVTPNSFELEANSGAAATLGGDGSSATATITTPGEDWNIKLYAKTGFELQSGREYRIRFDVTGADGCEVCYKRLGGEETDFGTETISGGSVSHTVTPSQSGTLEILLKLGNLSAGTVVTVSNVQIEEYADGELDLLPSDFAYPDTVPGGVDTNSFELETNNGTAATLTGDGSSATVDVTTPGDDWHIKLYAKTGLELEAGATYEISFDVTGADGCQACFKRVGGEETDFGSETISVGTVKHSVTPTQSGTLEILLKLGTVPAGQSVTVSNIVVRKLTGDAPGENLMTQSLSVDNNGSVNFWAHEDYQAALSNDSSSATLEISDAPAEGKEAWKVKLFAETGITLEAGKHYRISADVQASTQTDYEICYNDGPTEKGVGALYDLHASTRSQTVRYDATPEAAAELILQFNLGWADAPCRFTVSNITVEEVDDGEGLDLLGGFRFDSVECIGYAADDGYQVELYKGFTSGTLRIFSAPAERNPWNVKMLVRTGFTPKQDVAYRVSFDLYAEKPQKEFELFLDGYEEACYGQTNQPLVSGWQPVSYLILPGESKGPLTLQLRPGKTDGPDGNAYTFTNLKIEEVQVQKQFNYGSEPAVSLWSHDDYRTRLETEADRATAWIDQTPEEGREAWKTKLFVNTGVTLQAGQKYRVSLDVSADEDCAFEICYNNGGEEKGFGAMYGLSAGPETKTCEFTTYAFRDGVLIIQLSLGNCAAANSITVSHVKVEQAGELTQVSNVAYDFPQQLEAAE